MTLGTRPVSELLVLLDENMTLGDLLYFAVVGRKEHRRINEKSMKQRRARKVATGQAPPPAPVAPPVPAPGASV
jgi:hypothetical protein